eukprot:1975323-Rhodomonas_salina.2
MNSTRRVSKIEGEGEREQREQYDWAINGVAVDLMSYFLVDRLGDCQPEWACTDQDSESDNPGPEMAALPAYAGACAVEPEPELLVGYAFMHCGNTPIVLPEKFEDHDQNAWEASEELCLVQAGVVCVDCLELVLLLSVLLFGAARHLSDSARRAEQAAAAVAGEQAHARPRPGAELDGDDEEPGFPAHRTHHNGIRFAPTRFLSLKPCQHLVRLRACHSHIMQK